MASHRVITLFIHVMEEFTTALWPVAVKVLMLSPLCGVSSTPLFSLSRWECVCVEKW